MSKRLSPEAILSAFKTLPDEKMYTAEQIAKLADTTPASARGHLVRLMGRNLVSRKSQSVKHGFEYVYGLTELAESSDSEDTFETFDDKSLATVCEAFYNMVRSE